MIDEKTAQDIVSALKTRMTEITRLTGNDGKGYACEDGVINGLEEAISIVRSLTFAKGFPATNEQGEVK